ncbi:MAG: hypothetical protein NTU61_04865 [Candidatus Altiarchaeota archaeon]|nr:hypothetical protein [Candidatus Altiarchaeota archaeon]
MKLSFYYLVHSKGKGKLAGTLELCGNDVKVETDDEKLRDFLTKPYTTTGGAGSVDGVASDSVVTYKPYTKEFLDAVETECWIVGYIAQKQD